MQKELRNAIIDYTGRLKAGRILDAPAGSCWLQEHLREPEWEYYPADLYAASPNPRYRQADLNQALPYDDAFFDYVACFEGLEHLENYHFVLREFQRVLKPGGTLMVSTPNILNIKSRRRFMRTGTFYGFPHLAAMPQEGGHLHMTPVNLSFLISFAEKYRFRLEGIQQVRIQQAMWRFLPHCLGLKIRNRIRLLSKDRNTGRFLSRLLSFNILLNDNIFATFTKAGEWPGQAAISPFL